MQRFLHVLLASVVFALVNSPHAHAQALLGTPTVANPAAFPPLPPAKTTEQEVSRLRKSVENLQTQQVAAQGAVQQDDTLKKQVELLQKQIATQQKMILLLMDNMKKQPAAGVEKLETQVITLDARSKQAAQRDLEVSQAIDKLTEERDADQRN